MTTLVAISDQSDVAAWGWRGWAVFGLVCALLWVASRRENVRRQKRKKQGRA